MGIDAGFDMHPALTKSNEDKQLWDLFISMIKWVYKVDKNVEVKHNYIVFKRKEHPKLPFEGHKFLRFSSKISGGGEGYEVKKYIVNVCDIAQKFFGKRIHYWNEIAEGTWPMYDWGAVNDSLDSYDQPNDPADAPISPANTPTNTNTSGKIEAKKATPGGKQTKQPLFRLQDVPGKGKGLVAVRDIPEGTRIITEKPLFVVGTNEIASMKTLEQYVAEKMRGISSDQQRQFLSLHNNYGCSRPLSGTFKTNALPCGPSGVAREAGVFTLICRINHDCLPNAHNNWNDGKKWETIHAVRLIKAGEEITIAYTEPDLPRLGRRAHLQACFGFDCTCKLCSLPPNKVKESDARRAEIKRLDATIGDGITILIDPAGLLQICHQQCKLLHEEHNGAAPSLFARLYYDAFQIAIFHGDEARATVFADKSYRVRIVCEGEDTPVVADAKRIRDNPSTHTTFGMSRKWKRAKKLVPKNMSDEAFERWLWKL